MCTDLSVRAKDWSDAPEPLAKTLWSGDLFLFTKQLNHLRKRPSYGLDCMNYSPLFHFKTIEKICPSARICVA